ncbi:MAG: dihydroorotate dehydrogenase electron transfer subunit [Planctomycetes bacterium]|nr:dihydroorotate dehydrogenase electron transfer subunit [Planctomycetota bacterium]
MKPGPELTNGDAYVVKQIPYGPGCWLIRLAAPIHAPIAAGQFAHVRVDPENDAPLLRRPFSFWDTHVHDDAWTSVDLLYTVVGRGTALLERRRPLDKVGFLGPLGRGFTPRRDKRIFVFVAGGVGIVPFHLFAKQIRRSGHDPRIILLFGARTAGALWGVDDFPALDVEVHAATEDGSRGSKGLVTDLLETRLRKLRRRDLMIYTCGPDAMMKRVIQSARRKQIPCEASLERRMGCALGACGACVTRVRDGADWRYSRICLEGPTYDAADLVLDEAQA